jgi:hypothetical protein
MKLELLKNKIELENRLKHLADDLRSGYCLPEETIVKAQKIILLSFKLDDINYQLSIFED